MTGTLKQPAIVFSNRIGLTGTALVSYALEQGFAGVDWHLYSPAPERSLTGDDRRALAGLQAAGLEVRFHLSPEVEIAHANPTVAAQALQNLQEGLDLAARYGRRPAGGRGPATASSPTSATIHLALNRSLPQELDWATALANLSALVAHGRERGVTVCLENLRKGWTSDPDRFLELVEQSGAGVTFDLGHANSSLFAARQMEFLERVAGRVVNAHIYESEQKGLGHVAPADLDAIQPLLVALLGTPCDWWLVELSGRADMERTRALLRGFLGEEIRRQALAPLP